VQSINAAIAGLALGRRRVGTSVVTSAIEHSSTLAAAQAYGTPVVVGVDGLGRLDPSGWERAVATGSVAAGCLQVANHEVGTRQPYELAAQLCRRADVPLVLDATAALGRLDLSAGVPWSVLVGAAAAFGGPASVGILVIRRGVRWRAPYPVDDYQDARWPGQPDVPGIVAAAVALETWLDTREPVASFQHHLIDVLRRGIADRVPDVDVVGDPVVRVPHLLTCSVLYVDGETLTLELDRAGYAVSSGSACSASSETPSHVLAAMGALTHGNIRLGLVRTTTQTEVDAFLADLAPIVGRIRATLGAP
jgi:cysteine desulfurase